MKYWLTIGAVIILGTASGAYWWEQEHALRQPYQAKIPDVPIVQPLPEPATLLVSEATERPIMWASRRPPPPPRVSSQSDRLVGELNQSRLLAVVQSGAKYIALLRTADGRLVKHSSEGGLIRLENFDGRQATFVTEDGQRATRPMEFRRSR